MCANHVIERVVVRVGDVKFGIPDLGVCNCDFDSLSVDLIQKTLKRYNIIPSYYPRINLLYSA